MVNHNEDKIKVELFLGRKDARATVREEIDKVIIKYFINNSFPQISNNDT